MAMLVSLEQASAHLRRDTSDDDLDLTLKIMAASSAVLTYLGDGADAFTDSAGEVYEDSNGIAIDVPFDIQAATLILVGDFYKNREPTDTDPVPSAFGFGFLPRTVVALLYPYRTPVLG